VKLNVDEAVAKSAAKGAVGTVCRDGDGNFLGASDVVFDGITSPGTLEALACREGLDVADDLGIGQVHAATDCLEVVKGLQEGSLGVYSNILKEIRARMLQRGGTTFGHERRDFNKEAHIVARFASSLPVCQYVWYLDPPIDLQTHAKVVIFD
jgi:ribonuclease HI